MDVEKLAHKIKDDTPFDKSISEDMMNITLKEQDLQFVALSVDKESSSGQSSLETRNAPTDAVRVTTTKWEIWAYYMYYVGNA